MRGVSGFLVACLLVIFASQHALAHNLNQRANYLAFDKPTLDMIQQRALSGQPLLQAGDTVGLIIKAQTS